MKRGPGHVGDGPSPESVFLGQDDDAPAFGRFVGQGGELGGIGQLLDRDARRREKGRGLAVAQGDRPGLVEEQDVDVARGLDGAPAHGQDVLLDHAVDAGDADGVQQAADRRRDQADEEGDEHGHRQGRPRNTRRRASGT